MKSPDNPGESPALVPGTSASSNQEVASRLDDPEQGEKSKNDGAYDETKKKEHRIPSPLDRPLKHPRTIRPPITWEPKSS